MLRYVFILISVFYFGVRTVSAQETLLNGIHNQFEATRAMGMGNAFVAVADDENAIFYNPAGLKNLKENKFNMFLKGAVNPDILDLIDDLDAASDSTDEAQAFLDVLNANLNKIYGLRAPSIGMMYANPNWGFAIIPADVAVTVGFQQGATPVMDVRAYADTTMAYSRSWHIKSVKSGKLTVGVTGKAIYRAFFDKRLNAADLVVNEDFLDESDAKEGLAVDGDLGLMWQWNSLGSGFWKKLRPSLGLVVRNVADGGYVENFELLADGDFGEPEELQRRVDVGGAIRLPKWWVWDTTLAFDVRNMMHDNWTFDKGYHIGLEFNWTMYSWWKGGWRVGMNQGHLAAGFTGQLGVFKLDLATFSNEVGTSSIPNETRMYMFTASLDF